MNKIYQFLGASTLVLLSQPAFADLASGLGTLNTNATTAKNGLLILLATVAVFYLIYLAMMAFSEKKTWGDFGMGVVHISMVGGIVAIAAWAYTLFGGTAAV